MESARLLGNELGEGVRSPARLLPLEGGRNFRDLGGYTTLDGRSVQWGKLYRSGSMTHLTSADCDYLATLGIRMVCDLRTTRERTDEPNAWVQAATLAYWCRDYSMSFGEWRTLMKSGVPTAEQAHEGMKTVYRELPFEQAPAFSQLFRRIAAGDIPLVFNCTAGKDRTGTAAALILSALGVPRETVIADYVLSNEALEALRKQRTPSFWSMMPADVAMKVLQSHPDYLLAALTAVEDRHGSIEDYLQAELELTAGDLTAIREQLLE